MSGESAATGPPPPAPPAEPVGSATGPRGAVGRQGELPGLPERLYPASPSRLTTWLDCPRRYRLTYLDRPKPAPRPPRAHTSIGIATHNALRDWWDAEVPQRTPALGAELLRRAWVDAGFRDPQQSARWRERVAGEVSIYATRLDPTSQPRGIERSIGFVSGGMSLTGRIDRLDDRDGELVVVDYKTSRRGLGADDARTSLPMALYAAAVWKLFRRRCLRVELHHVPTGEVVAHEHTPESLTRKVEEAKSIAADLRRADRSYGDLGAASPMFEARTSAMCPWCDVRAHCPAGQAVGPEKSGWAALGEDAEGG